MEKEEIERIASFGDDEFGAMMHNLKEMILQRRTMARLYLYSKEPLSEQQKTNVVEGIKRCTNNIKLLLGL